MRAQRWEWTHRYGMPLFVASVVSVILAGSSLIAVVSLTGDPDDPPNPPPPPSAPPTAPPPPPPPPSPANSPDPTESPAAPVADLDPDCVIGTWTAAELVDTGFTGTWTMIDGEPIVEYRAEGRGTIDYGNPESGNSTTYEFEDVLGNKSNSVPSDRTQFEYTVVDNEIRHIYDVFNAARMLGIPYVPSEDTFAGTCEGDTMVLDGENGYLDLRRR